MYDNFLKHQDKQTQLYDQEYIGEDDEDDGEDFARTYFSYLANDGSKYN
jgi:hypothetical protein